MPLSSSMATSTIVLSAPAKYNSATNEHSFTVLFNPPDNVAGRACYLKCVSILPQVTAGSHLDVLCNYFCGISFPQPLNYTNINNPIDSSATVTATSKRISHRSDIVGAFTVHGDSGGKTLNGIDASYPRCLVHVPMYQNDLTVRVFKSNGTIGTTTDLESLTVVFELTPMDGEEPPRLAP